MRKTIFFFVVLILASYSMAASYETAYAYRTGKPDPQMAKIPQSIEAVRTRNPGEYLKLIALYINENSENDFDRIKKAHDFTALLIRYDAANFLKRTVPEQSFQRVLRTRLAVCEGYSNVFQALCGELEIPCVSIHGYARGIGSSLFVNEAPGSSNHAWNIVTINRETYLVDCTWDSGYLDGRVAKQEYSTEWLFVRPEHFLYTHFPEDPRHQLLEKPLTADEFVNLPFYKPMYFDAIESVSPELSIVTQVEGTLTLEYLVKEGFEIKLTLHNENGTRSYPNNSFTQCEGEKYVARLSFPQSGKYTARIFAHRAGAGAGTGKYCGEFGVIANNGSGVLFPTQYDIFTDNTQIISPIEMPLERGKTYDFRLRADNKKSAAIIAGRNLFQLTKGEDEIFSGEFEIPRNISTIVIGVDSGTGRYQGLVQYQVK